MEEAGLGGSGVKIEGRKVEAVNFDAEARSGGGRRRALEIAAGPLAPLYRIFTHMRNRRGGKRAKSYAGAEEAAGNVVVPALVRSHGRVDRLLGQTNRRQRDGQKQENRNWLLQIRITLM